MLTSIWNMIKKKGRSVPATASAVKAPDLSCVKDRQTLLDGMVHGLF